MKYPISVIVLIVLTFTGTAQSRYSKPPLSELPRVTIHLKESGPTLPGAFSHFEVIDERADTTRIGIHTFVPTLGSARNQQLVFPLPASPAIAGYLNKYFSRPGAQWHALIVLRNLWLSDANYLKEDKVKDADVLSQKTHIRLKAEIYACRDSEYIPILRFDTLQTYKWDKSYISWSSYYSLWETDLTAVLSEMADSISGLTPARVANGRRLHRDDILQFNQSRFDPAITASDTLRAGVYASFQEFRDNTPSVQNFEIQQRKGDRLLYLRDGNGELQYSHDAWGYCDGRAIFIMRDGKLYPLWQEGKAFYFFSQAYKEHNAIGVPLYTPGTPPTVSGAPIVGPGGQVPGGLNVAAGTPAMATLPAGKVGTNRQRIYTVDMDSGTVY